ncbi:protein translocase subunit SecD, partial [Streptomyces sp. NPDC054841]
MTRATAVRAVLAALVLLVSVFIALTQSPRLGLDLQGGTRMVLQAHDSQAAEADRDTTERTMEVLRQRIDALGVAEPTLTRSGENRIVVELPDVQDPRKAAEVLGRTAQLSFHAVEEPAPEGAGRQRVLPDEQGRPVHLGAAELSGAGVQDAVAQFDAQRGAGWYVAVEFRSGEARDWAPLTGQAACHPVQDDRRRVAIVLDDQVISSPQVDPSVACGSGIASGSTQITGSFSADEARELALLIKGGALPVPVETVEQRTVGPTLGAAAISASAQAAVIGAVLTALFVTAVYRLFGALAAVALVAYAVISYAALVALGVTLTLPGLAGFVLAIGMAVAVIVQLVYLASRFRWTFAVGCVIALVHDVTILIGAFAWLGRSVDGIFLAALLTVIGYSVNDSLVVFDRVRELWGKNRGTPLPALADTAVLQTVPRTVNTGMGALFILCALAVLGGDSLADFALALLIGVCVGTYSSVLTAVPAALVLEGRWGAPAATAGGRGRRPVTRRDPRGCPADQAGSASGVMRLRIQGGGGKKRGASVTDDNAGDGVAG